MGGSRPYAGSTSYIRIKRNQKREISIASTHIFSFTKLHFTSHNAITFSMHDELNNTSNYCKSPAYLCRLGVGRIEVDRHALSRSFDSTPSRSTFCFHQSDLRGLLDCHQAVYITWTHLNVTVFHRNLFFASERLRIF